MAKAPYTPDYSKTYGSKYQDGLDIKEIAKLVRTEIRKAVKSGVLPKLKASVKISRYSGGRSLSVNIKECSFKVLDPAYLKFCRVHPHESYGKSRFSETASDVLAQVNAIAESYNYDGSDTMTDYFNVNYYTNVGFDYGLGRAEKELEAEQAERAERATHLPEPVKLVFMLNADLTSEVQDRAKHLLLEALVSRQDDRNWLTPDDYNLAMSLIKGTRYEPMTASEQRAVSDEFRSGNYPKLKLV